MSRFRYAGGDDAGEPGTVFIPSITITASRSTGVAPLVVHFSIFEITTTKEVFHDLGYTWNFGDTDAGTWQNGRSRDTDHGPMAGHLFEKDGTFKVTVTSRDSTGIVGTGTMEIIVTDPNTVFSGINTVAISTGVDFTGAPSGADEVTTSSWSTIMSHMGDDKRVLLKRGDSWSTTGSGGITNVDTAHLGAFGTGTSPDAHGIFSNDPALAISGSGNAPVLINNCTDIRIEHITFTDSDTRDVFVGGTAGTWDHILFNKLSCTNGGHAISVTNNDDLYNVIAVCNCNISQTESDSIFIGSRRLLVLGNTAKDTDLSAVIRIHHAHKGVVCHNDISGAATTKHALKLHGPTTGSGHLLNDYIVVRDNVCGTSGAWTIAITPQNSSNDEPNTFVLVENNRSIADYGTQVDNIKIGILLSGSNCVIRNNIIDGSNNANVDWKGINLSPRGSEGNSVDNEIYNNTIYHSGTSTGALVGVNLASGAINTIVRNNLADLTSSGSITMLADGGTNTTESNNVLTSSPAFVDPDNATPKSRDWNLTGSSTPAIDLGTDVNVWGDFDDPVLARIGKTYDVGAHEF